MKTLCSTSKTSCFKCAVHRQASADIYGATERITPATERTTPATQIQPEVLKVPRASKTSCFKCIVHNEAPTRLQKPRGQTKRWHNENINCENIMFHIENIVPQMHCLLCLHIYFCHHFQKESAGNVRAPEVHLLLDLKQ